MKKTHALPYKLISCILIPFILLIVPPTWLPLDNLSVVEQRVIALFAFAALFWIFEPIPIFATSMIIIVIELVMLSDSSVLLFQGEGDHFGVLLSYKEIMATLASPVIMLFLGGFFLASAATKYRLDHNLARVLLHHFGNNPKYVLLGIMTLCAIFSMFMSNTATTAMMLSIILPVLHVFDEKDNARVAFVLAVPIASNLGGMGTPIGTPPNAIALKFLTGEQAISFGEWMAFGVPFVIIMILISWGLILFFFPIKTKTIHLVMEGSFIKTPKAYIVYGTFILTVALWLSDFLHGMNTYVVGMIPIAVFLGAGIINKEDLKSMSWDVLWLVAGGIALGLAIEKTGFANHLISSVPFQSFSPVTIVVAVGFLGLCMANFMSHTATANLLLPMLAVLGTTLPGLEAIGGSQLLVLSATFAISLGMSLPISSPPNALAHATGAIQTKDLAKTGLAIGLIGFVLVLGMIAILKMLNFFS